ncbi:Gfo/Idh/MocA family protein [Streptomyces sp. NPDC056983]|uniref:Gfo/Idh/MocA family protein n=1 Tax=Streptomyces sp. NPDC056983 TaxID=3345987 RepID=UPI003638B50B
MTREAMTHHPGVAIIGTGMIGAVHARAARAAGARLLGVLASSPERTKAAAQRFDVPVSYADFGEVLADDRVEVVHLCTPNALHADQAEAALHAGKQVICEKPLATSVADADRVAHAARATGRIVAVPFVYRYHPLVREIRARREAGEFGNWHLLHGSYLQDWLLSEKSANWRTDPATGGASRAFADIGSHWCDLVEWVAGVRFTDLTARLDSVVDRSTGDDASPTEDVASVLLRTAEGVPASLTVSQVSAGRKNRLWFELDGSHSSAAFDQEHPETVWLGDPSGARVLLRDPDRGSPEQRRLSLLPAGHPQGYGECFAAFVSDAYAAMRGEQPCGLPVAEDGVRAAHLVEAVLRSSHSLSWTAVHPNKNNSMKENHGA